MTKTWIVAKNVFLKNLKSPAYYWMLLAPFVFALVGIGIGFIASKATDNSANPNSMIGIVGQPKQTTFLKNALKSQADVRSESNLQQAKAALAKQKIDAYITLNADYSKAQIVTNSQADTSFNVDSIKQTITSLKTQTAIASMHLSATQVQNLTAPADVKTRYVSVKESKISNSAVDSGLQYGVSQASVILIFIFLSTYIQITGSEIGTEKGSRIIESLLAAVPARQHFIGKIIAIAGLLMVQLAAYAAILIAAIILADPFGYAKYVNMVDWSQLGFGFAGVVILLAFAAILLYIVLAAVFASMVSRQEDVPKSTSTVMYVALIPYALSFMGTTAANSLFFKIMSFIPLFSQSLMPMRMAVNSASTVDGLIAFALQLAALAIFIWLASGIYAKNVLNYDDGKPLTKLLRTFKIKNS
ncbi:ABC transporter permease [Oenococcus sicerae]|uniref:ABC transporter permease n=1 Tax=Oenococcus sicerae TaxID=2203724 RepID=A0AAJ1REW7_9LACO|nr:ABC transporter permease [Oenococcus sicerae]MDN6900626.1 ABC transporter permease [Oenococcus sicerae]